MNEKKEIESQLQGESQRVLQELLSEKKEKSDEIIEGAILEFRSGSGGEEAYLFSQELSTVYKSFLEGKGYKVKEDEDYTDKKMSKLTVAGETAYDLMLCEAGVHKVIRIPKTESKGRLHSSTAVLVVLPQVPFNFELNMKELDIEFTTSQGPGGQHVNKTESACRITHIPTGIQVCIQKYRVQHQNKLEALNIIKQKIYQVEREKKMEQEMKHRQGQVLTGDRSEKIRTYNFQQDRITDH